jgi:hypothetical protein
MITTNMKKTIVSYEHSNNLSIQVEKSSKYYEVWLESPKTLLRKVFRTDTEEKARLLASGLDEGYSIRYNE